MVLKYLAKLTEKIDSCTTEEQTVPEWCTKVGDRVSEVAVVIQASSLGIDETEANPLPVLVVLR